MGLVKRIGNEITFVRAALRSLGKLKAIREDTSHTFSDTIEKLAAEKGTGRKYGRAFNCFSCVKDSPEEGWKSVHSHLEDFHGPPIRDDVVDRWAVAGPPENIAARLNEFIDVGVTHFQLVVGDPDQFGQMKKIADQVLPLIKR